MMLFFFTEVCFKKWCCLGGFFQRGAIFGEVRFYEDFHLDSHMIWSYVALSLSTKLSMSSWSRQALNRVISEMQVLQDGRLLSRDVLESCLLTLELVCIGNMSHRALYIDGNHKQNSIIFLKPSVKKTASFLKQHHFFKTLCKKTASFF